MNCNYRSHICLLLGVVTILATNCFGQKIVGCYSDLREISEGIVGSGLINIWLKNEKYAGTFAELSNELGLVHDETRLRNISFDKRRKTIRFDITFYGHTEGFVRGLKGKVSKSGIKMDWGNVRAQYGRRNPFFRRANKNCSNL